MLYNTTRPWKMQRHHAQEGLLILPKNSKKKSTGFVLFLWYVTFSKNKKVTYRSLLPECETESEAEANLRRLLKML